MCFIPIGGILIMNSEMNQYVIIIVFTLSLIVLVRLAIPYKIKRILRKSEYVRNNLNNKNVRKYISFLRMNSLINTPEIGHALRETQLVVNKAEHIEGKLKLGLYQILKRKRVVGVQAINPIYLDKNGNRI